MDDISNESNKKRLRKSDKTSAREHPEYQERNISFNEHHNKRGAVYEQGMCLAKENEKMHGSVASD